MTESSGRLDPLQSYPAITIPSFLWGNTHGREIKLDQILLEWQGKEMKQSIIHSCQSTSGFVLESKAIEFFLLNMLKTIYQTFTNMVAQLHRKYRWIDNVVYYFFNLQNTMPFVHQSLLKPIKLMEPIEHHIKSLHWCS